ncbi:MAG TPA: hypothetical protein VIG51_03950 [Candidatus Baltobacteraceae bacterium]|nr:hypothetical protein [Candidatus Baltobacteraceae bacterium]
MSVRVVPAAVTEWPQIEALRRGYFEPRAQPIQRRGDDVKWLVALDDRDRVVGCYSFTDAIGYGQRWALDFYRAPGHSGTIACAAMWRHLKDSARAENLVLAATIAPDNEPQLQAMMARGGRPVGIILVMEDSA